MMTQHERQLKNSGIDKSNYKYRVALSFAGEQREYVEKVAEMLQDSGIEVFYDKFEQVEMWGKNLVDHFEGVFSVEAEYIVMFLSKEYAVKDWTGYERQVILNRWITEQEVLLPVKFDDSKIKGLPDSIGYINLANSTPEKLAQMIIEKISIPKPKKTKAIESVEDVQNNIDFELPKKVVKVNPYKERNIFIESVEKELKRRSELVSDIVFHSEDVGEKKQIRILHNNNLVYALDIHKGGMSDECGISFTLDGGTGYNAWGNFEWDKDREVVVLNLSGFMFDFIESAGILTSDEFVDKAWKHIINKINELNT